MADPSGIETSLGAPDSLETVVVLLTGGNDRQWAADAAIDLCSEWASAGRRVVLADLHLENPLLHQRLEVPNLEGMVDIFLYGASLARIARPVRNGSFFFIPAGTYTPDSAEIYRNPRWRKLVAGFQDTDANLVLFAPGDSADVKALSSWSRDLIVLGPPLSQERLDELTSLGLRVRSSVEPPVQESTAPVVEPEEIGLATDEDLRQYDKAIAFHGPAELDLELPPPPKRPAPQRTGASIFLWMLLALVILAAIGYLLFSLRPNLLSNTSSEQPSAAQSADLLAPPSRSERRAQPLPYSVPVKAFSSLAAAQEEVASNQQRLQSVPFYISAESDQGILYYRVFAGTSPDTVSAGLLREQMIEEGMIDEDDSVGSWSFIERTPLAFDLGEFETMEVAAQQVDSLVARSIPVYATAIPFADGTRRWQLYGGAFRDSATSVAMHEMLAANGISPRLAVRSGALVVDTLNASQ